MSRPFARRGLVTVVGVALALIAGLVGAVVPADETRAQPAASAQCTASGRYTMCTTDPRLHPDGKDLTIVEELQRRIRATGSVAHIQIAMYEWTLKRVANDLVAAKNRGATVQIVIGRNSAEPTRNDEVIAILRGGGIPVTQCADACLPNRLGVKAGAMHNKFMLVEDAGSKTVVQTSTNLTVGQVQKFQNLIAIEDDNGLFDYYRGYWNRMNTGSWKYNGVTWNNADRSHKGDHDLSKAYLLPVTGGDPIVVALNNVTECRATNEDDRIWVSHSIFERPAVRARLIELHNIGCDVKVLVSSPEDEAWVEQTVPGKGKLSTTKVRSLQGNHNKFIVIDAKYAGQWRKVVFTGSHNITNNSLNNANDVMLRVIDSAVVNVYINYFRDLYL